MEQGNRVMYDWEAICHEHGDLVWASVYRVLNDYAAACDCCQEVFLEAWQRASKEPVLDWEGFLRWLSVRRAIDHVRQRHLGLAQNTVAGDTTEFLAVNDSPAAPVELDELMARLVAELAKLPGRQAEAFWLRAIEDRPYAEIAQLLATNSNEVGVLIHRARDFLRLALSEFNPSVLKE